MTVVVIDYEAGNLFNVGHAVEHLGAKCVVSDDPRRIATAERVILPGVGSAETAMRSLGQKGLVSTLRNVRAPFLGICLGMQLLLERSREDDRDCLGMIPGTVERFSEDRLKVPHVGWNRIRLTNGGRNSPLFRGVAPEEYFYFVHSYFAPDQTRGGLAWTEYGERFCSALSHKNFSGVQFHPERSGEVGLRVLRNFLEARPC